MSRPAISYPIPSPHPSGAAPIPIPNSSEDAFSGHQRTAEPSSYHHAPATMSSRPGNGQARGPASTLDSYITRLLVVTKQLLQGLEQWSQRQLNEDSVSDIYVRLGNGFEMCVTMFRRAGISTADLDSVPNDLRDILERALAEEPSQETLNIYLPDIRAIIFSLLSGLKNKQLSYKRLLADRQQAPEMRNAPHRPPRQHTPVQDMEARSVRSLASDGPSSPASGSVHSTASRPPAAALAERSQHRAAPPGGRAAPPPDAFRPARPRTPAAEVPSPPHRREERREELALSSSAERRRPRIDTSATPPQAAMGGLDRRGSREIPVSERTSQGSTEYVTSRFSADSDVSVISSLRPTSDAAVTARTLPAPTSTSAVPSPSPFNPTPVVHVSLTDDGDGAPTGLTTPDSVHPTARSSLALLQKSEALERRASKRFSSYTFNKMLPTTSPSGRKSQSGISSPPRPARRSDRIPAMPPVIEDHTARGNVAGEMRVSDDDSVSTVRPDAAAATVLETSAQPSAAGRALDSGEGGESPAVASAATLVMTPRVSPGSVTAFLQLGRQVKKAVIELPLTMSALRLLFMERFEYDPGMEDFPNVYIRDNKTGVQYELEDMDDVTEGCVLALDFEPLDQVKQHFDLTFASLAQDIKELKMTFSQAKRQSVGVPPALLAISPAQQAPPLTPEPVATARMPQQPALRSASGGEIVPPADLQPHYEEVQNLRRDLAVMRQLHVDFLNQTKESFSALRAQNAAMKEIVKTKMGGNRALLDNSKAKLEGQCQDTIQAVEEVSDIIDGAREDALRRGITPSRTHMGKIRTDLSNATKLVDSFASDVTLAEPTWRATWLIELQRVTEEQRLLAYQNKLAADLKNDIKDATDMLDNVQAFIDQRASGAGRSASKKFQPPPPDEGTSSIGNLLLEIRTKEADPSQRLRAIEERQKARERDLASRTDEFQDELSGFVQGRRLRKTGGTDEADRVRQRRQDQTIRRMLSDDVPPNSSPSMLSPQGTGPRQQQRSPSGEALP